MAKKKKNEPHSNGGYALFDQNKSSMPIVRALTIYLLIVTVALVTLIFRINTLIKRHDEQLTGEICTLVTEKMNRSISYMTSSAQNMAAVLSAQDCKLDKLYSDVKNGSGSYESIGFIDQDKNIYATDTEKTEFEKWNLIKASDYADPISISPPYRSALTGELVFTIFTGMTYEGGRQGKLFVTYPLKEIQNMASADNLNDQTEIWLMDAASNNLIQCAGTNKHSIGSWNNAYIRRKEIEDKYQDAYDEWKSKMDAGEAQGTFIYRSGNQLYTQVFAKADFMYGWYVVVRMPSSSLSDTLVQFRYSVLVFSAMITCATVIMFIVSHNRQIHEKIILENLSIHDPLTSVMNRRAFDLSAEHTLGKLSKSDHASLLFLDVDYFKEVNDRFGHESGDIVLKSFASALSELFGQHGSISRYGGDEFLVLTSGISRDEINAKLSELQKRIRSILIYDGAAEENSFKLSFSAGGADFPADAKSFTELKSCADEALYIVKKNGRNGWGWYDSGAKI